MIRKRFFKNSVNESRCSHRTSSLKTIQSVCFPLNRNKQNELSYCVLMFSKLRNCIQHSNNLIVNISFMQWWTVLHPTYKIFLILVLLSVALVGYQYVQKLLDVSTLSKKSHTSKFVPNPEVHPPASASILHQFKNSAVSSDSAVCSKIGSDILERENGNVIDAAIATLLCNGITIFQSMGIGGGFIMNYYVHSEQKAYTMNAKEVAPIAATENMFKTTDSYLTGPLTIGVPGEVKGYWDLYKKFGSIPWKELVQPTIKICEEGFEMTKHMYDNIDPRLLTDNHLRNSFYKDQTEQPINIGDKIHLAPELCQTYKMLAGNGGEDFYNGTLAKLIAEDLRDLGSIITLEDLNKYSTRWGESLNITSADRRIFITPPPSNGVLVGFILNVLSGYNFTSESMKTDNNIILTYHRIAESFKFAFGYRTKLPDPDFVNSTELVEKLLSSQFADEIREKIVDDRTSKDASFYGAEFDVGNDHGTSHVSIIAPNGDAISVTSSVNLYFGIGKTGKRTGILFNSGLNDFAVPNLINYFGLRGSPSNYIVPGKRAVSSMSPSILTDVDGEVQMVIGAAGGTKIITSVALVLSRTLWFNQNIKEAIDAPRVHHQLVPMDLAYEFGNTQQVIDGLEKIGHHTKRYADRGSVICAIAKNSTGIFANADFRKAGNVVGI